jgi:hypothetical protein
MKRIAILLVVLAFGVAACGDQASNQTDAAEATASPTVEATPEPTPDETDAAATDDGGSETALADLIPDDLNGVPGTTIPNMDQFMAGILSGQGIDADQIEFEFVTYGQDENAVVLTAFRIPGVTEAQMQLLARMMSGAEGAEGVEAEAVDVGGKSVLRMTASAGAAGQEGVVYMYFSGDAAFTIVSPSGDESAAEALLAELP